jgi:hypothetical protein
MSALLRDFGEPDDLSKYEILLKTEFVKLEKRVETLPTDKQSQIIARLTDQLLEALARAQQEAEQESTAE